MPDFTSLRHRAKDTAARGMWLLPHDARRSMFLRARPRYAELYRSMRTHDRGGKPQLGLSVRSAEALGCLFIHIPKTGGTSIGRTLFGDFEGNHMPIATYQMIYDRATFDRLFKFAVVRNPYDRLLSAYRFFRNGADRVSHSGMVDGSRSPELQAATAAHDGFEDFVLHWLTPAQARQHEHFRPQHRFACAPNGVLRLDYVGRFETLDESFADIAARLGVDAALIHDRRSRRVSDEEISYVDRYTPAMRSVVERIYDRDLRLFGYSFGD